MKKRLTAMLLVLVMAVCAFPTYAFADNPLEQTFSTRAISKPAQDMYFKDCYGDSYYVYSGTLISETHNTGWKGYILVIQDVLDGLYKEIPNGNFNPFGVDGKFGPNTKAAVVSFQVAYLGADQADGVVGPTTWWYLYNQWIFELGCCSLSHVNPYV